jgi:site-specific DNA recombinase
VAGFDIPIPRDGGLQELLIAASARPRAFNRVIVESISRLSRNSSVAFRIEDDLRAAGVRLCCADEQLEESFGTIVLRHVNIGIARGYHHELMVKSRQGQETSTRQGWHTGGIAPYGYRFVEHDHPNPHKAARGQRKRTLEPDPVRAPVVRRIYDLYLSGGMGITQIRDALNADSERCPPPVGADPARALGTWSRSIVWEILRNPKYTGYQVWNRRARKTARNRDNPPESWVWSQDPAHPPIVSEEYEAVAARAASNRRTRQGTRPARFEYLYRGILHCGVCGLRMWGNHRKSSVYYSCQPSHQRAANIPADHPPHVYLNQRPLHEALVEFLSEALFGPDRAAYWHRRLKQSEAQATGAAPAVRLEDVTKEIGDLQRRIERQVSALEAEDTTPALRRRFAARIAELEQQVEERQGVARKLADEAADAPPTAAELGAALDRLPLMAERLSQLPQPEMRALLDTLHLQLASQRRKRSMSN